MIIKLIIFISIAVLSANGNQHTVELPDMGSITGSETYGAFTNRTIYQFLGVRFAEPPTGVRRFKAPLAVAPWFETRDQTKVGRQCPTYGNVKDITTAVTEELEDCLHLSVYSTDLNASRPVMVYFHGGGFYDGAAAHHPPNYLLEEDIVLVVPQYRLGPLGFLSTMSDEIPGNAALLDCVLALEWVQKYVSTFGGDPSQVTIFGQSAGAAIVSALILSPAVNETLFRGAIMQSGSAFGTWIYDENPVTNARDIGRLAGCNGNATLDELNNCFMEIDVQTLMAAVNSHVIKGSPNGLNAYGGQRMTIGGPSNFLPRTPFQILREGGGRKNIALMAGVTKHDGSFSFVEAYDIMNRTVGFANRSFNAFNAIDLNNQILGLDDYSNTLTGYQVATLFSGDVLAEGDFSKLMGGLIDIHGVAYIKGPTLRAAQGNALVSPERTFLYSFDYEGKFTRFGYGADMTAYPFLGGIHHSNDNIYVFPWPEFVSKLNAADTRMAKRMVKLWTSFATSGVPSAPEVPDWPPMTRVNGPYLHINVTTSVGQNFYDEYSVAAREGGYRKVVSSL